MKTFKHLFILGALAAALSRNARGQETSTPALATNDSNSVAAATTTNDTAVATTQDTDTLSTAEFPAGQGLRLNFREAPMETVLGYMSRAAGYVIHPMVAISGRVTVWSDEPLSKEEALDLVEHVLSDSGYAVIRDGRLLTIISSEEAKRRDIPVKKFTGLADIPRNSEVVTYILPVRTLNPIALLNNLRPLIGNETDLQANESANSLLITDTQLNIRRLADIVTQLDSVSASINTIKVYPLKYADAKAVASLMKELFPSQDASRSGQGGGNLVRVGGGGAGGGGFPGLPGMMMGPGGNSASTSSSTPGTRVTATADDHSNSLVVSAPGDLIPEIDDLVLKLDLPTDDITEVRVFHFQHADPTEMVTLLGNLFPDDSNSTDAGGSRFQFGAPGGGPFGMPAMVGTDASGSSSSQSQYMKKLGRVLAVADQRTQSLLVSAAKDLMPQIEGMVRELDESDANVQKVHYVALKNANPQDIQLILQDLFPAGSSSSSSSTQNNPLQTRATTLLNSQLSSGASSGTSSSTTSATGGSRTGL